MKLQFVIALALSAFLSACATLNEQECKAADWFAIGYEDGSKGRPVHYIAEHREACAKHHITPSLDQYRQGHTQGLAHYCTPQNGYSVGRSGSSHQNVCTGELAARFLPEYHRGRQVYVLNRQLREVESEIRQEQQQIDSDRKRIYDIEQQLIDAQGDAKLRQDLIKEMRSLEDGIKEHQLTLEGLEHKRGDVIQILSTYD